MAVLGLYNDQLNFCDQFLNGTSQYYWLRGETRFPNYRAMHDHFSNNVRYYTACRMHLDAKLNLSERNLGVFGLPAIESENIEQQINPVILEPYKATILPLLTYLDNFAPNQKATIGALFLPGASYKQVVDKLAILNGKDAGILTQLHPTVANPLPAADDRRAFFYKTFRSSISPEALLRYIDYELKLNEYSDLTSPTDGRFLSRQEILARDQRDQKGRVRLQQATDWLSLAIAQQRFLVS